MDESEGAGVFFGLFLAILAGIWLVKRDGEGDIGDEIGDALVMLTSTDESRLSQLEPETQAQVRGLIQDLANGVPDPGYPAGDVLASFPVHVGNTLRTQAEEKAAIASGHSAVKSHSWHEIGRAVDLYPIDSNTGKIAADDSPLYLVMQQAAVARGFRQIAFDDNWDRRYITNAQGKKIWDGGHMEWRGPYDSIAEAVNAEGASYGIA